MSIMNLENKTAIVTGSTKGIGRAIAEKFAKCGANVVITGRTESIAVEIAKEIADTYGVKALGVGVNVTSEKEIIRAVDKTIEAFGAVDILINNAGIQTISPLIDFSLAGWNNLINIHLTGSFVAAKECMKHMIKNGKGGKIITIGSAHSVCASANKAAYVSAKHAQVGLTRSIALEGGKYNISSNMVSPGFVWTDLVKKQIPERAEAENITEEEAKKSMVANTVDGEFSTLDDVSNAALFFASFESNALTGQSLIVSHGWNMQ
jgi:3-hydroxybutyrate dehydrogenase